LPVSGTAAVARVRLADDPRSDRSNAVTHAPRTETRRRGTSKRGYNDGQAALAVDATATFVFSGRSFSGAKAEALIVSTRCDPVLKELG
jgi:hypothetical protein